MRIACVYLPSFPLQAHIRRAPHLAGTSLVVADGATGSTVVACSRAAWADGIRPGMGVAMARAIAPELAVVVGERELYQRSLEAVIESLMACSDTVDSSSLRNPLAPHQAIYVKVPPRCRGTSFGQKLLTQLSRQGFRGRIGVADDRFTAYVAAVRIEHRGKPARLDAPDTQPPLFHQSCTVVPRGGSAKFLAPLPLSYLPIDRDVQHLLETCGITTLGDFAALPPPSVSRDRIDENSDFQALARGHGPASLRGESRDAVLARPLVERVQLPHEAGEPHALAFALRSLCEHVSQRLSGRGRRAEELCLRLVGPGAQTSVAVVLRRPTLSGAELLEAIDAELALTAIDHSVVAVELEVTADAEPAAEPAFAELFTAGPASQPVAARAADRAPPAVAAVAAGRARSVTRAPHCSTRRGRPLARPRTAAAQQVLSFVD